MLKLKNDALPDDVPLVVVGCTPKTVIRQYEIPPPPAWIMPASPDWRTHRWLGIISPSEADHYAKQLEGTQKYVNGTDRVAHIDGQLMQL